MFAVLGVRVIVDGQAVLAQVFEDLSFVDAVDLPVTPPQELLGVAVVIGDQPVDDVLPLNLLDVEGGEVCEVQSGEVEAILEVGPPLLDGAEASIQADGADLDGDRIDEASDFVGGFFSMCDELVTGPFNRLEEPAVARFIGPELLAVRAADLGLARGLEVPRLALGDPGRVRLLELRAFLGENRRRRLRRFRSRRGFRRFGRGDLLFAAVLFQPGCVLRFDAGLGGLDLGRVGLRKQSDQFVLVRPLPVLELGVLGQGLEVADLHGRDLVLE